MSILVIDSGNSAAKFGLWQEATGQEPAGWCNRFALPNARLSADEAASAITEMIRTDEIAEVTTIVLASVVPDLEDLLYRTLFAIFHLEPQRISHKNCGGMQVDIDNPAEVGADRLVNAYAAKHYYGSSQLIIDFGTATTIDVLDKKGNYAGGVILPGLDLSLQALHFATAKLPLVSISRAEKILGKNTFEAINQGIYWGYVSMLEGLCSKLQQEIGHPFGIIATGSYANLLGQDCPFIDPIDPELTLKGLVALAKIE